MNTHIDKLDFFFDTFFFFQLSAVLVVAVAAVVG